MTPLSSDPAEVNDYTDGYAFGLDDGWFGVKQPNLIHATPEWRCGYQDGYQAGNAQYIEDHS